MKEAATEAASKRYLINYLPSAARSFSDCMATVITEKPIASAIVTAQIEIHMVGPHDGFPAQRAYGDLVPPRSKKSDVR